jgi:hypothetical protein
MLTATVRLSGQWGELVEMVLASPSAASAFWAAEMVAFTWSMAPPLRAKEATSEITAVSTVEASDGVLRSVRTDIVSFSLSAILSFLVNLLENTLMGDQMGNLISTKT